MTRIIAGFAGSLTLAVPRSGTRPTSDRVREAIFSALEARGGLDGLRVLDLYAGSGALGLEAASRGAIAVTLVEKHPAAARVARQNASIVEKAASRAARPAARRPGSGGAGAGAAAGAAVRAAAGAAAGGDGAVGAPLRVQVAVQAVLPYLRGVPVVAGAGFDVVFIDPPYELAEDELAEALGALVPILAPDAIVLVERSSRSPEPSWPAGLELDRQKSYGETVLWWASPA